MYKLLLLHELKLFHLLLKHIRPLQHHFSVFDMFYIIHTKRVHLFPYVIIIINRWSPAESPGHIPFWTPSKP